MVEYRRNRVPGGTYFFTVTLNNRRSSLLFDHIELLREAFRTTRESRPFSIDAIVILPDHLHTLWTLPPDDNDLPGAVEIHQKPFFPLPGSNGSKPG